MGYFGNRNIVFDMLLVTAFLNDIIRVIDRPLNNRTTIENSNMENNTVVSDENTNE